MFPPAGCSGSNPQPSASSGRCVESWGTGVRRMVGLCREQGMPDPEYITDGHNVKIVFWKPSQKDFSESLFIQKTTQKTTQKELAAMLAAREITLTEHQMNILTQIVSNPKITRRELELANEEMSVDGIKYNIARLQALGLLHREGGRKSGRWIVTLNEEDT